MTGHRRMNSLKGITAAVCLLVAGGAAVGDTVVKKSGETIKGIVSGETATEVTLETNVGALVVRTHIPMKDIASIQRDAAAENRYCRIPIHGVIGEAVTAEWMARALDQAAEFGANYIVFDVDSPGGEISEMAKIIDVLEKQKRFTLVAHIKKAMSASAIISLACKVIVMEPQGAIGAAVPWKIGPTGTPKDVEAKFLSAYRAVAKGAAEYGHHEPLLAEGMFNMDTVLSAVRRGDMVLVVEGTPEGGKILKKASEIMCLSTVEAVGCGLAVGSCDDPRDLQKVLGTKDWAPVGESVWAYMESRAVPEKPQQVTKAKTGTGRKGAPTRDEMNAMVKAADVKIAELTQQKEAAAKRVGALPMEFKGELNKIDPRLPPAAQDAKTLEIRTRYETAYAEAQNTLTKTDSFLQDLVKLRAALAAKLRDN